MKFTYDWLTDYLDTKAGPDEIASKLTEIGLEIDDVATSIPPIVAKIVECRPHENSDHLHVLMVDDASGTLRQVVCGAPNARAGLVSVLARPGCKIGDMEITSGKIRGVLSDGMMCSARELGIGGDHSGIIELDEKKEVIGQHLSCLSSGALGVVFDAGITPNRPDYLAVRGIARDLSASGIGKYRENSAAYDFEKFTPNGRNAIIKNYDACPAYYFCEIRNINIAPSNKTVASRLAAIGINPKNAPIDATNYVCYDMGQPLHCFDADEINGDIIIRNAKSGEKFTDLFGAEHELIESDLVITDSTGILALAGVVGGLRGMTTDATKNILIESAYFDPVTVRKTSRRLGVSTDASYRYERGIDPTIAFPALASAVKIIHDACGGDVQTPFRDYNKDDPRYAFITAMKEKDYSQDEYAFLMDPRRIEYNPALFKKKTGIDVAPDVQREILERLGFGVKVTKGDAWTIAPVPARVDVVLAESIVSEIIRIYGYENIATGNTAQVENSAVPDAVLRDEMRIKHICASMGLCEHISYGFANSRVESLVSDALAVRIANPIIDTMDVARSNLISNLLDAVQHNVARGYGNLALFELGVVFDGATPGAEHKQLVIMRTGDTGPKHWSGRNRAVDIFDVKSDLQTLVGANTTTSTESPAKWAHPYQYGRLMLGKKAVAEFGTLHPRIAKQLKIKTNVVIGIINNIDDLPKPKYKPMNVLSEFQPILRDFAFVVDVNFPAESIIIAARNVDARIKNITVFDAFNPGDGKKSIGFQITIQPESNMTDADLMDIQNKVITAVEKNCPAKIRDK